MRQVSLVLSVLLFWLAGALSLQAADREFESRLEIDGQPLELQGQGTRSKLFIDLYDAALYTHPASQNATKLVAADAPMGIALHIVSDLISAKKLEKATREGFVLSTGGDMAPISTEIEQFLALLTADVKKGDRFLMRYAPGRGTMLERNGAALGTIPGLAFKQALFGIWLGKEPVQFRLKQSLLGK